MDIVTAKRLVRVMDVLKMRRLENRTLLKVILPQVNRDNVLELLNMAHYRVLHKKRQYKVCKRKLEREEEEEEDLDVDEDGEGGDDEDSRGQED